MKAYAVALAACVGLVAVAGPVSAQYRDDYGYRDRGSRDRDDRDRDSRDRDRDRDYGERRRDRGGFDEREYLRCNPDVRQAVNRGTMESGAQHYRVFGRRENRRLSC